MRVSGTRILRYSFSLLLLLLLTGNLQSQIAINSPYTRYGLGMLVENRFETRLMAMGGVRYGMQANDLINPANPASYAAFDSVSFVFQAGLFGIQSKLITDDITDNANYLTLSHLIFGFQITPWWKTSFGLLPYSYVGYNVYTVGEEEAGLGRPLYTYQGSGGINQFYWGNSFTVYKGLSVGFNAAYLFGNVTRERAVGFPDNPFIKNTRVKTDFNARDFVFDFGVQYLTRVKKKYDMIFGAVYGNKSAIDSKGEYVAVTYFGDINTPVEYYDTIAQDLRLEGQFTIPQSFGFGLSFAHPGKFTLAADFDWQNWEDFQTYGRDDSLQNSWSVAVGGEFIPDINSISSYYSLIRYRVGLRYARTYLNLRSANINEIGISFGLGLPLRKSRTSFNIAVEAGRMGTIDYGLIQENYIRFTIGVNITERWFVKSKYF